MQLFQRLGLVDLQEGHGVQGGSGLSSSAVSLGPFRADENLQALDGRRGLPLQAAAPCGQSCMAMARSTGGTSTYPWAAPPSRVVRTEEALGLFRAEKGAFQDLVTSSCTSGKNGTGGDCRRSACAPGTNHPASSARETADAYSAARCSQRPGKA